MNDPNLPQTATSIYRYYDQSGILLYVGITDAGSARNVQHNRSKEWWQFVDRQEIEHASSRPAALSRERALIQQFRPPFNVHHNPQHDSIRDAYLSFRERGAYELDPEAILKGLGGRRRLPLDVMDHEPGSVELWSRADHFPVSSRIVRDLDAAPLYLVTEFGKMIGAVNSIVMSGPFLRFRAPQIKRAVVVRDGWATLKCVNKNRNYRVQKLIVLVEWRVKRCAAAGMGEPAAASMGRSGGV